MAPKYHFPTLRLDSAESVFFSRQLEHVRAQAFEVQFAEHKGRMLVPVNNNVNPGAEEYTYQVFEAVGYAEWSKNLSRGPRVDLFGTEATTKIRHATASYGFNVQEMRSARMAGLDLPVRKPRAARRAIEQILDDAIWNGGADGALKGLLNQSSTTTYTVPNGAGGTADWESKTPDEIAKDLFGIESAIITGTLDIERPDTLILPLSSYQIIATTRMGDGSDVTILKHFLANAVSIKGVERSHKLETAGSGGTKRMVAYAKDPDKLEAIIPLEFSQLAPQPEGFEIITDCEARSGGVVAYFPKSIAYGDGI